MKTIINQNHNTLKYEFKNEFLNSINSLKNNKKIVIWLSWGSSLTIFYSDFLNIFEQIEKSIREKIFFAFLDERIVDFDNDDSNYKQLKNQFLDDLINNWYINQVQILLPDFSLKDYKSEYFKKVQKIDIWLFWVGPDCHTCSLFPNHELLKNDTYSYLKIDNSPKPPKDRITISVNMLKDTNYAFWFFMWKGKSEAFERFLDENINSEDCPIKLINECKNTIIYSDII